MVNSGCIIVAVVAACLISVDLAHWNPENDQLLRVRQNETEIYIISPLRRFYIQILY